MSALSSPSKLRRGSNTPTIRGMSGFRVVASFMGLCLGALLFVIVTNNDSKMSLTDELLRTTRHLHNEAQPTLDASIKPMIDYVSDIASPAAEVETTPTVVKTTKKIMMSIPPRPAVPPTDLVKTGDYIYYDGDSWDAAPIVIESHKLVFFSVPKAGCTVWKQLFRRMMGFADWSAQDYERNIPHDPNENGLKYLSDYSLKDANFMMTSPEWTRAVMVRDPKTRFLSSFLDKAMANFHQHIRERCCLDGSCVEAAQTPDGFLELIKRCDDAHWRSQNRRIDHKYWPYIDVVLHTEDSAAGARSLLERIGAWEEFGASGWGSAGTSSIFQNKETEGAGEHATYSQWKVWQWFTPPIEEKIEAFYRADYENPLFGFKSGECLTCEPEKDS